MSKTMQRYENGQKVHTVTIRGKRTDFVKVGEFGVDAGLCWIGDPCYILHREDNDHQAVVGKSWLEFCELVSDENMKNGVKTFNYALGHSGFGVCTETGYGDGIYNVYATYVNDMGKRIGGLFIDFMGLLEDEEEEAFDEEEGLLCVFKLLDSHVNESSPIVGKHLISDVYLQRYCLVRFEMESDMKWSQMVVKNIKDNGMRVLVRPFVLMGDFVSTAGVSVTMDMETVEVYADSTIPFVLINREDPEKYRKIVAAGKQDVIRLILAGRSDEAIRVLNGLI